MTDAISSHGTMLQIGDGATPTEVFATVAEVRDISGPGFERAVNEAASHTTEWMEVVPGLKDAGEITFDLWFIPTEATHGYSSGLLADFDSGVLRNFKLVFPDASTTTWAISAYVVGFSTQSPVGGILAASLRLRISGAPTLE